MNTGVGELTLDEMDNVNGGNGKGDLSGLSASAGAGATVSTFNAGAGSLVSAAALGQMVVNCVKILSTP